MVIASLKLGFVIIGQIVMMAPMKSIVHIKQPQKLSLIFMHSWLLPQILVLCVTVINSIVTVDPDAGGFVAFHKVGFAIRSRIVEV